MHSCRRVYQNQNVCGNFPFIFLFSVMELFLFLFTIFILLNSNDKSKDKQVGKRRINEILFLFDEHILNFNVTAN